MITIGEIRNTIIPRPGISASTKKPKQQYFVPDQKQEDFWSYVYHFLRSRVDFQSPVQGLDGRSVNPFFGYFGTHFHPTVRIPHYFHIGLDFTADPKEQVHPIAAGVLEYAGYGVSNGNYVMLSHPTIQSKDGFVLYSLYMHLRKNLVGFTTYQKMLREISLHSYPEIVIPTTTPIGTVGDTGNTEGFHTHVHVQCEFRHRDGTIVAIDPAPLLDIPPKTNLTADIKTNEEFLAFYKEHGPDICNHCVEKYWDV